MTVCIRCRRPLKNPTATGMGPVCARATKAQEPAPVDRDLFGYDIDRATLVARERVGVTILLAVARAQVAVRELYHAKCAELLGGAP